MLHQGPLEESLGLGYPYFMVALSLAGVLFPAGEMCYDHSLRAPLLLLTAMCASPSPAPTECFVLLLINCAVLQP